MNIIIHLSFLVRNFRLVKVFGFEMRFVFTFLVIIAALLSILIIGLTIFSIMSGGGVNFLFPGLGLVISLWFIVLLLAVIDFVIILLAFLARSMSRKDKSHYFRTFL